MVEIAAVMRCSVDTLENRFSDIIKEAKEEGKTSLRRYMWKAVEGGSVTMMIWLSKQLLDMKDKIETDQKQDIKVSYTDAEKQAMKEQLKAVMGLPK